jgi:hypothetical protein
MLLHACGGGGDLIPKSCQSFNHHHHHYHLVRLFWDSVDNTPGLFLITKYKDSFLLAWKFTQIQLPRMRSLDIFQQYDLFSLCLMFSLRGLPYVANSAWPVPGLSSTNVAAEKVLWKIRLTCNWTAMSIHWDVLLRESAIGKEDRTWLLHHPCLGNVQHQLTSCFLSSTILTGFS